MTKQAGRLRNFLFAPASDQWLGVLRIGLGLQVTLYAWSLRFDWGFLYSTHGNQPFNRALAEAILSAETTLTPRLGWLIAVGRHIDLGEATVLSAAWLGLFVAGVCLLVGLFCRPAAILAWFLYLCSARSGILFSYGVDNFTIIGLFYLMIAPLPDRYSIDWRWRKPTALEPVRLGFHRRVLQLHLCFIYFFGGISKSLSADWWNGNSVWRALTRPPFDLILPDQLIRFGYLLPAMGILVCLLETGYPIFIWLRQTRPFWLAGVLLMHLSIGLAMGLYLFALIMVVFNLAAFGPDYLAELKRKLFWRKSKAHLLTNPGADRIVS